MPETIGYTPPEAEVQFDLSKTEEFTVPEVLPFGADTLVDEPDNYAAKLACAAAMRANPTRSDSDEPTDQASYPNRWG